MLNIVGDRRAADLWRDCFDNSNMRRGEIHWDYPWTFACWLRDGLSILPQTNLITNIGFGPDSTHFKTGNSPVAFLPSEDVAFPLRHPPRVVRNVRADRAIINRVVLPKLGPRPSLMRRVLSRLFGIVPDPMRRRLALFRDLVRSYNL